MMTTRRFLVTAGAVAVALATPPVQVWAAEEALAPGELYTACNLWFEKAERMFSINYQTGQMIPVGTKVRDVQTTTARDGTISFVTVQDGRQYTIYFQAKFHPGKTVADIRQRLFTSKSRDGLCAGFTDQEKQGIQIGTVQPGMSKAAVLVCWGYPPEHMTPNHDLGSWLYWRNRFANRAVDWDSNGKVAAVR
jgi:hypothetical protein